MDFQTMDNSFQNDFERAVFAFNDKCNKTSLSYSDWAIGYGLYSVGKNNGFNVYPYFTMLANSLLNAQVTTNLADDAKVVEDNKRTIKFDLVQTQSQSQTDGRSM